LEVEYFPGTLGNLLSLGAAHFWQSTARMADAPIATVSPAAANLRLADC